MKVKNKIAGILLALTMCIGMVPTTAFAYVPKDANVETEATTETPEETESTEKKEEIGDKKEDIYGNPSGKLEGTEKSDPLTPDGNLSLVDDVGKANGEGKQFITVVTKTGNYFYIIIDRDDKWEGTVHFLNQVNEADLFHLLDEVAQEKYIASLDTEKDEPEQPVIEEPEEPETEEPVEKPKKNNMAGILGILAVLGIVGAGGGYYFIQQNKKKKAEVKPDPDADYDENDGADEVEYLDDDSEDSYDDRDDPVYDSEDGDEA